MQTLIKQCIKGKRESQKEFFLRFSPKIYALCRRYAVDDSQAKDFVQDSFIQVFKSLKSFDQNGGNIEAWIYTVSKNAIFQELRRSRNKVKTNPLEVVQNNVNDEDIIDKLSQQEIMAIIEKLPLNHRRILNLCVFEQQSHREISEILGITEGSSRSQLTRARAELKKRLQNLNKTNHESRAI